MHGKNEIMTSVKIYQYFQDKAASRAADDFWGQVGRTLGGKAVGEEQIAMIVQSVLTGLDLGPDDVVLDIGCGNGALTDRIFDHCRGGLGIDLSDNLIAIAGQHFASDTRRYVAGDALALVREIADPGSFTKILCYGSMMYFPAEATIGLLATLRDRFTAVDRIHIGNLPDKDRMHDFHHKDAYVPGIENDHETPIGLWRTEAEFARLSEAAGWHASFSRMPDSFYASRYRYDATLTRAKPVK